MKPAPTPLQGLALLAESPTLSPLPTGATLSLALAFPTLVHKVTALACRLQYQDIPWGLPIRPLSVMNKQGFSVPGFQDGSLTP